MDKTPEGSGIFGVTPEDGGAGVLRPAPLFRTVGLTAGLPPHRRLRSVLNPRLRRSSTFSGPGTKQDEPLPEILRADPQKDEPQTGGVQRRHRGGRLNLAARTRGTAIKTEEYLFEEVWRDREAKLTRMRRYEASDLSRWIRSLEITDSETKQNTNPRSSGRGDRAGSSCKGAGPAQRDRRPHFLPPITQSDRLLKVPQLLPDNSPPPSPCCPPDILFFPLSVPHIRQTRALQPH